MKIKKTTAPASRYVTGRDIFPKLKLKLLLQKPSGMFTPKLYHTQGVAVGVGEAVGEEDGDAVAKGVAEGFAVAPFLSPVMIKTSEVPEVPVVVVTF